MFCINCGQEVTGKFCSNCGTPLNSSTTSTIEENEETVLFECQPSGLIDKAKSQMNVNATRYILTNQRIIVESGLLSKKQEEIELHKIKDFSVKQSLTEKIMGIGNIEIMSIDASTPLLVLSNVENPFVVKDKIRLAMLEHKKRFNISYREML